MKAPKELARLAGLPPPMPSGADVPFAKWARRLRSGDRSALGELFQATHAALFRYAFRLIGRRAAAQDVVQNAFVRVWSRRTSLDPERSLRALLYVIVRNQALKQQRNMTNRRMLRQTMEDPEPTPSPEAEVEADLLGGRLRRWIDELPARRREAFELSRFSGLTYKEIAAVMDISVRTVEQHVRLALQDLRDRLRTIKPDYLSS